LLLTRVETAGGAAVPSPGQELVLLENVQSLLAAAMRSLASGDAPGLLEASSAITSAAGQLNQLFAGVPWTGAAPARRRTALADLRGQCAFCRAMLRRWRRAIGLRQQLLGLRGEAVPYTESLRTDWS